MYTANALKVTKVWETGNTILEPNNKEIFIDIIDKVASLFSIGPFYYYIINFKTLAMDYVHDGIDNVLGIKPRHFSLKKLFDIMHPDDLEYMHKKETLATNFLLKQISAEKIPDYKVVYLMRLKHKSGDYRTILQQTKVINTSLDGKAQQVLVIHTDITYLNIPFDNKVSLISPKHPSYHYKNVDDEYVLAKDYKNIFTKREIEIIKLISEGKKGEIIADKLHISLLTVNTHKKNILKKSNCKNSNQLIAKCIRLGII